MNKLSLAQIRRMIGHKFNAKRTERDGISFQSKAEALYYDRLKLMQDAGVVLFFLRQVPIHIPGGKYVVDFQEFHKDGSCHFVDVKGFQTSEFKFKKRAVEQVYPFHVELAHVKETKGGTEITFEKWEDEN